MQYIYALLNATSRSASRYAAFKRLFDLVFCMLLLIPALPLMALVALAIKLESRGPALFLQKRGGMNHTVFTIYKFRTMVQSASQGKKIKQVTGPDERLTRLGRFLRKSSLDEVPQLFNVLKGDMSLIGPRPHALVHDQEYGKKISNYYQRQTVRPGITGWAQVNGFVGATPRLKDMQNRVTKDIEYTETMSFWLDMKILILTARLVICDIFRKTIR